MSIHKWSISHWIPPLAGFSASFGMRRNSKVRLAAIAANADAVPALKQRDFVSISKHEWTQLAQPKNLIYEPDTQSCHHLFAVGHYFYGKP